MLWTNIRSAQRATCLRIRLPSSSNLAILRAPFFQSFSSKSESWISPEVVTNGGQDGLIRPLTFSTLYLRLLERVLVWYALAHELV